MLPRLARSGALETSTVSFLNSRIGEDLSLTQGCYALLDVSGDSERDHTRTSGPMICGCCSECGERESQVNVWACAKAVSEWEGAELTTSTHACRPQDSSQNWRKLSRGDKRMAQDDVTSSEPPSPSWPGWALGRRLSMEGRARPGQGYHPPRVGQSAQ